MHPRILLLSCCTILMGISPCDILETPVDTDTQDTDSETLDCTTPCMSELRVDIVRSDNGAFYDGAYDFSVSMPEYGDLVINCFLLTSVTEQPLDCTYAGPFMPSAALEDNGTTIVIGLPAAPTTSTWVVAYGGGEVGRKEFAPTYAPKATSGCEAMCVQADEVMAIEIW